MPITVMKSDPTLNQKKIKRIDSSMDLRTTDKMQAKDFQYWVSTNIIDPTTKATINIVVSRCNVTKIGDKKYIIGRELGDPMYANI